MYDFKDNKTTGTVTVTKVWDDNKTNEERTIPDIKISTEKPSKSALGYTVTFHGNKDAGLVFDDGSDVNEVVYNSSGQIVDGKFQIPSGIGVGWYTDATCKNRIVLADDGTLTVSLSDDIDLWADKMTFTIKGYNGDYYKKYNYFNYLIPDTVTEILFTDEIKPTEAEIIDVDADRDGGVVAWTENDGTVMKVSTQIKGVKVQAAIDSRNMFYNRSKLTNIDLSMLDTQKVTDMSRMFFWCSGLTSLDLTTLNTLNVTDMESMFSQCHGLTSLDLTGWDTSNVTNMRNMFSACIGLTTLDLSSFDTQNVTDMGSMFNSCRGLTTLDLSSFDTQKVTDISSMFSVCRDLTALDLSSFDTQNVTDMGYMFSGCSGLTALDLTPLNTTNVTNMRNMFSGCSGLTSLDLTPLDTSKVTDMSYMFSGCSGLTNLDLSSFNTQNVISMSRMFYSCSGLTALDLSSFNTHNVTSMIFMFENCRGLTTITTGPNFKFVGTDYYLSGTWQNTAGETFNGDYNTANFPSNVADTYTKISN